MQISATVSFTFASFPLVLNLGFGCFRSKSLRPALGERKQVTQPLRVNLSNHSGEANQENLDRNQTRHKLDKQPQQE